MCRPSMDTLNIVSPTVSSPSLPDTAVDATCDTGALNCSTQAIHGLRWTCERALVRLLEQTTNPHTCPHGRPTVIRLSSAQLEREFGRT